MLLRAAIIVCSTNSSNNEYELDKKEELFNRIEKAILELGIARSFHYTYIHKLTYLSVFK